jgi:hypothetical protein
VEAAPRQSVEPCGDVRGVGLELSVGGFHAA